MNSQQIGDQGQPEKKPEALADLLTQMMDQMQRDNQAINSIGNDMGSIANAVNTSSLTTISLIGILIEKGIFTRAEIDQKITEAVEIVNNDEDGLHSESLSGILDAITGTEIIEKERDQTENDE